MIRSPSLALRPVVSVSRTICLTDPRLIPVYGDAPIGQRVRALVLRVAGVALDPMPLDVVLRGERVELAPQVFVLHRLLVRGAPAFSLPIADPRGDALHHVDRIGVELDAAAALQRLERADR